MVSHPMLPLTLVYDHRVIDGAVGARFLAFLKQQLAEPAVLAPGQ
ncbi:MAG TPA: 2-oxo acid dehydrogenase subunit E2 [Burkholderiaceae bacterium]|nr:2-oxo acid dehydrogenase subunit E2 [Burkholderiaceae bacterium]